MNDINLYQRNQIENLRKEHKVSKLETNAGRKKTIAKIKEIAETISIFEISEYSVKAYLRHMDKNKAAGYDNIGVKTLRNSIENSAKMIALLINKIIEKEKIPKTMKVQVLRPLFKGGTKTEYKNYRPIALLTVIEKIFEKYIFDVVYNFMVKHKVINPKQFAYQKGKSTSQILSQINDEFNDALSLSIYIGVVFFDLSKAFDTLDRPILIEKLNRMGIRGKLGNILRDYCDERKICTKINNE